ncbi:MAG: prenyltransferase/squalene oxidase repeat-containing protein [Planctomycetota bacterium]|jgi:hypothetical protein
MRRRGRNTRDLRRQVRQATTACAWLGFSATLQLGAITLVWDLWLSLPPDRDVPRTGFFAGMQAPRRIRVPPPEIPEKYEPRLEPPERPPLIVVDPLADAPDPAEHRENLGEPEYPDWAPDEVVLARPWQAPRSLGPVSRAAPLRDARDHRARLRSGGGSGLTEDAVALGLRWLTGHQDVGDDGKWDCDDFPRHDPADDQCDGAGDPLHDVGVTGLALLAFLGAGHTDRGSRRVNEYGRNVRLGLRYLLESQAADGVFGPRSPRRFVYDHAIATLTLCEVYGRTRNPRYRRSAQEGLDFLTMARNPYLAWRYHPRGGENDTSVTGWCVLALKAGQRAGLTTDPDAFAGARNWLDKITDPEFGQVGYNYPGGAPFRPDGLQHRFPPERSQAMTALAMLCRIQMGEDPRASETIRRGVQLCLEVPPVWNHDDGSIDMYYWYFGTMALFEVGGAAWKRWNQQMLTAIVQHQHPRGSGARTGSWDPIGVWGDNGGRVYATALMTMCLEVYYRYDRVFGAG